MGEGVPLFAATKNGLFSSKALAQNPVFESGSHEI